ncbi:MAG TPA: YibE/F family protein [Clostridia bacterium]|nr:YibE/F family protein [Clostridia bacterium]
MARIIKGFYFFISILILCTSFQLQCLADGDADEEMREYYEEQMQKPDYTTVKAKVLDISFDDTREDKPGVPRVSDIRYQHLNLVITTGSHKGETFTVKNTIEMINPYKLIVNKDETILLRLYEDAEGNVENLVVYERSKEGYIYALVIMFMLLLVIIGGLKGFKSAVTLVLTAIMVVFVLFPLILKGWNPIATSAFVCTVIAGATLLIISGRSMKTLNAFLGTVSGVLVAGALALIVGNLCKLTGLGNEDAQLMAYVPQLIDLDYKGLLFAGIIIGALGAVMDVTMSIASALSEIVQIQPDISTKKLIQSGMNIGRDTMGTMSNTLILAYAGGSIHTMLLLMAFKVPMFEIINMDVMASEILRAMAGSIGLICAIPLTALLGGVLNNVKPKKQVSKKVRGSVAK